MSRIGVVLKVKENSIEELQERLETLHVTQDARLACNADDLDIREEIAEVEEEIKELQDDINVDRENSIKNERSSIEEDIILLKDFTEGNFKRDKLENYKGSYKMGYFYYKDIQQAIEHILSDYKRVLKENEELKNKLHSKKIALEIYNGYIPKSKLKDVIDRIDYDIKKTKEIISKNTNIYASYRKNDYQIVRLKAMNTKSLDIKKRLQELLESEE